MSTRHRQVTIAKGTHVSVEVDEEIAPFLQALWTMGFFTQFSCQGDARYHYAVPNDYSIVIHGVSGWTPSDGKKKRFPPVPGYVLFTDGEAAWQVTQLLGLSDIPFRVQESRDDVRTAEDDQYANPKHWAWTTPHIEDGGVGRSLFRFPYAMLADLTARAQKLVADA